jgi:hypothetical protein
MSRLINLNTVSSIVRYKNKITVTYNFNASNNGGVLLLGSGVIEQQPHTEDIIFENEKDAEDQINSFELFTIKK